MLGTSVPRAFTAGKENRGIACKIEKNVKVWHNPLTVDMFGNAFYHGYDCAGDDNIYAFENPALSDTVCKFIVTMIDIQNGSTYSYNHQFRQNNADTLSVYLPSQNGMPDYDFIETYMETIEKQVNKKLNYLLCS